MNIFVINYKKNQIRVRAKPGASIKGLRYSIQKIYHNAGVFGLEFWIEHECGDGRYTFDVLSPYGESYVSAKLEESALLVMGKVSLKGLYESQV